MQDLELRKAVDRLRETCRYGSPEEQFATLCQFEKFTAEEGQEAIPMVLSLLQSNDSDVRSQATRVLGELAPKLAEVGPALFVGLQDPDPIVRRETVEALGNLPYPSAVPKIAELLLKDPDDMVRVFAAETLGYLDDPSVLPALFQSLDDPFYLVVSYALSSIGLLGNQPTLALLRPYQNRYQEDVHLLSEYFIACYRLGDRTAFTAMVQHLLQDKEITEDTASIILNMIKFLIDYDRPKNLGQDGIQFIPALKQWDEKFPIIYPSQCAKIIQRLEQLYSDESTVQEAPSSINCAE